MAKEGMTGSTHQAATPAPRAEPREAHPGADSVCHADLAPDGALSLVAYVVNEQRMAVVPAAAKRKWMDETDTGFANRCLPLLIANQWGWFILSERKIELIWNGGPTIPDIHIHYGKKSHDEQIDPEKLSAVSHFGHGILTFRFPYLFQTPADWNLYVRGPANWCKDGICPLDGVVETDWSSMTFTMNWKVTRKDTWITFEEGEPICQVFPIPRGSPERFWPEICGLSDNPELEGKYKEWRRSRGEFNRELHKSGAKALWQKHYFRGTSILGEVFAGHQTKLAVRGFRDTRSTATPGCGPAPENHARPVGEVPVEAPEVYKPHLKPAPTNAFADAPGTERAGDNYEIVVSSENNSYMAWQTQLFCYSALTHVGKRPTVVVHRADGPLRPEFSILEKWGCRVIEAPQFRQHPKGDYPARNEVGSLLTISALPEFRRARVLFCESDMLFVKRLACPAELAGEYYSYLDYKQERIRTAARKFGIEDRLETLNENSQIGVPYLIPGPLLPRLAERWMEVLDAFEELDWIDIMYAFGLALAIENMSIRTTHLTTHNLDQLKRVDRSVIHFCYGDERWSKRAYLNGSSPLDRPPVSVPKQLSGTVLGEILHQIRQASACGRFPRLFNAFRSLAFALPTKSLDSHVD